MRRVSGTHACEVGASAAAFGADSVLKWRATVDEDGHYSFAVPL
jgi:hypothetical protein